MLAIISPAKTLDFESAVRNLPVSQPHLTDYSEQLIEICRQLSPQDLSSLMSISDKLAGLNAARFAEWTKSHNEKNSRAAIWAFNSYRSCAFRCRWLTCSFGRVNRQVDEHNKCF